MRGAGSERQSGDTVAEESAYAERLAARLFISSVVLAHRHTTHTQSPAEGMGREARAEPSATVTDKVRGRSRGRREVEAAKKISRSPSLSSRVIMALKERFHEEESSPSPAASPATEVREVREAGAKESRAKEREEPSRRRALRSLLFSLS